MRGLHFALVALPLLACDPGQGTEAPDAPQVSEQEQRRQAALADERTKFAQQLEQARAEFAADKTFKKFEHYCHAVESHVHLSREAREGVDVAQDYEELLRGAGKQFLDQIAAEYADKKKRTPELRATLKAVLGQRIRLVERLKRDDDVKEDGLAMLVLGYPEDGWEVGDGTWSPDLSFLEAVEKKHGRKVMQQTCRTALDRIVADDRRDRTRQHYVFEACVLDQGDWEADLAEWAKANETKDFRKTYAPIHADAVADLAARRAERAGKQQASARGEAGSDKPLVMLINSCDKKIRLVIGDDPASAGGRKVSLMGDQSTHERIKADMRVWLVDDKQKVIAHATVSRYTSELEFTCTGVIYH